MDKTKKEKSIYPGYFIAILQVIVYSYQLIADWNSLTNLRKFFLPLEILFWSFFLIVFYFKYRREVMGKLV